ncbi:MAG: ABC transporter permease [Thermomicrobiales bacterium]|nr:ABC transporter permease [Thermomicrobiales bacterium]
MMLRWFLARLLVAGATVLGVTTLVFALIHLAGDPLAGLVPPGSSPEQLTQLRHAYGLDRPLPEQYLDFLAHAARGDFGESWRQKRPALDAVRDRLPATLILAGAAMTLAAIGGGALGVAAGARIGRPVDWIARSIAMAGQAAPAFLIGAVSIFVFAVRLRWLPASGFDGPAALVLPTIALAAFPMATTIRLVRAGVAGALDAEFVRTARGKGLTEGRIVRGHVLRNALLPALAFAGFQASFLLSGATVVEAVFSYPGIGQLALIAVADRDLPVIEAYVATVAVLLVFVSIAVDVIARWADPRLRENGYDRAGSTA